MLVFPSKNYNDKIHGHDPATLRDSQSFQRRANKKQQQDLDLLRRASPEAAGPVPVLSRRGPQRRRAASPYPSGVTIAQRWRVPSVTSLHVEAILDQAERVHECVIGTESSAKVVSERKKITRHRCEKSAVRPFQVCLGNDAMVFISSDWYSIIRGRWWATIGLHLAIRNNDFICKNMYVHRETKSTCVFF